jgi:hypothetical protein
MDLAYRIIDGATVQVTSPALLASRLDIEFYPVGPWLSAENGSEELMARVRRELGEQHLAAAVLEIDPPSKHLIAVLPQPQQRKLAELLGAWRAKTGERTNNTGR